MKRPSALIGSLFLLFTGLLFSQSQNFGGSGGGGIPAEAGPQSIVVSPNCPQTNTNNCFYTPADTKVVWDASITSGTKAVTCPNNDCNFVAATDNGKSCWGVDSSGVFSFTNAGGLGTLTVTGAQAATCDNGNTAGTTQTGTLRFAWGHRDYANLQAAAKAGTIFELLITTSAAGVNASSGAFTVLKNGVAQSMTCTVGTGTSCTDGATAHQVTVAKGDLISIQFTTQAAETLANPKVDLIIW